MPDTLFAGHRVLVAEDEYFLADELNGALQASGAAVIGPVASVEDALAFLDAGIKPDAAVLDMNLGGEPASPIADVLLARNVPFLFTTGYDQASLPQRYATIVRLEKPVELRVVLRELGRLLSPA